MCIQGVSQRCLKWSASRVCLMSIQGVSQCFKCKKAFDLFNRRHHCRSCGRIFCRCPRVPPPPSCVPLCQAFRMCVCVCVCVCVRSLSLGSTVVYG